MELLDRPLCQMIDFTFVLGRSVNTKDLPAISELWGLVAGGYGEDGGGVAVPT